MADLRADWTDYALRNGLIRDRAPEPEPARNKFGARPVHVDGIRCASMREAARFIELRLLQKHGRITELDTQPVFPLHIMEIWRSTVPIRITTIGRYTADFRYLDLETGEYVIEDTKSPPTKTEAYRLRKRAAEAIHGITVTEL